ncbi:ARM repeat-containing protein [Dipodascopsis tothii]|uniref:ARM repeat-containing protein n=1 Tax=Dipodascopsis tothii TaxID=44089 RepID=UPI0034CDE159
MSASSRARAPLAAVSANRPPPAAVLGPVAKAVGQIFQDAQRSTISHPKLAITLADLQQRCADQEQEDEFAELVTRLINRVLGVKKSEAGADRIVKFCNQFVAQIQKDAAPDADGDMAMDYDDEAEATLASRFVEHLFRHVLRGVNAKDKTVRYRSCQVLALLVSSPGEIDDDLFLEVRSAFVRRLHDKEAAVRVQAVIGLARLQGTDDEDEPEPVAELLLAVLQHDPAADVRRAAFIHIEKTRQTLPYILERARDTDAVNRRCIYTRVLPEIGDFRLLSISMREKLLGWGLKDRDASVRNATVKLFATGWIENTGNSLLELLERLDVLNSQIAEEALQAFFTYRQDVVQNIRFDEALWSELTAESIFLVRAFVSYCRAAKRDDLLEERLPELTKLGFYVENYMKFLDEYGIDRETSTDQEFVLEQLLHIVTAVDLSDEVGRRKIFSVLHDLLVNEHLPETLTDLALVLFRRVCNSERDFCQVSSEIIAEIKDKVMPFEDANETPAPAPTDDEDSFVSADSEVRATRSPAETRQPTKNKISLASNLSADSDDDEQDTDAVHEIMITLKCLHITQCMLGNVQGKLQENVNLMTLLNTLIVPAVRSHRAPIRERGLHCLGLCCLIDSTLAAENLGLFVHCFDHGHEGLQIEAIHIVSDMLMTHGTRVLGDDGDCAVVSRMLAKGLQMEDEHDVQTVAAEAACKLMLAGVLQGADLLKTLVVIYFDASSETNLALRQTLSYCLPVYALSRPENQRSMSRVVLSALKILLKRSEDLDEDEEMVSPTAIAAQLADWTDPRKVARVQLMDAAADADVHLDLALEMLPRISSSPSREERKVLCGMLAKLYIPPTADAAKLDAVRAAVAALVDDKSALPDAPSRNALAKLALALARG